MKDARAEDDEDDDERRDHADGDASSLPARKKTLPFGLPAARGGVSLSDLPGILKKAKAAGEAVPQAARVSTTTDEVEARFAEAAGCLDEDRKPQVLSAVERRQFTRAIELVAEVQQQYPRNLSLSQALTCLKQLAKAKLEDELGALHRVPRVIMGGRHAPQSSQLLRLIDGSTPFEGILRHAKQDRLKTMETLADMLRRGFIEVPTETRTRPAMSRPLVGAMPPRSRSQSPPPDRATIPDPDEAAFRASLMKRTQTPEPKKSTEPKKQVETREYDFKPGSIPAFPAPVTRTVSKTNARPLPRTDSPAPSPARVPPRHVEPATRNFSTTAPTRRMDSIEVPDEPPPGLLSPVPKRSQTPFGGLTGHASLTPSLPTIPELEVPASPPSARPFPEDSASASHASAPRRASPLSQRAAADSAPLSPPSPLSQPSPLSSPSSAAPHSLPRAQSGPTPVATAREPDARPVKKGSKVWVVAIAIGVLAPIGAYLALRQPHLVAAARHLSVSFGPHEPGTKATSPTATPSASSSGALTQTIQLSLEVQPVFARVLLDGVLLTSRQFEYVIPKDGRKHTIRVESAGFKPRQLEFQAERDVHFVVALDLMPPRK